MKWIPMAIVLGSGYDWLMCLLRKYAYDMRPYEWASHRLISWGRVYDSDELNSYRHYLAIRLPFISQWLQCDYARRFCWQSPVLLWVNGNFRVHWMP